MSKTPEEKRSRLQREVTQALKDWRTSTEDRGSAHAALLGVERLGEIVETLAAHIARQDRQLHGLQTRIKQLERKQ